MRVAVVGVGLIGGSVALAARRRANATISAFDADPAALAAAVARGAVQRACSTVADAVEGADAAFVAVPVGALPATVAEVLAAAGDDCVVSDVGSVKRVVVERIGDERFVGGHPLAGAQTSGVEHAREDLFDGATWYLTPTERTSGVLYERLHRLLCGLGARPAVIDAAEHDRLAALVSHLPHVLANELVCQAARALDDGGLRLPATGPSFRDATRVAGAPSSIWSDIFIANRDAVGEALAALIARLQAARELILSGSQETICAWIESAAAERRALVEAQLAGEPLRELRVAVPNRPGVIARLALALARQGVNIADLALHPAADMSQGVVALWVADGATAQRAAQIVQGMGFPVALQ